MITTELIISILASTLRRMIPLLLASMGGTLSMRAGVVDLGLEGMMLSGAFFGVLGSHYSGNVWVGLVTGMIFGMLFALLHAVLHVTYRVNGSISGMVINLLAIALTPLLLEEFYGLSGKSMAVANFESPKVEWLDRIPIIGPVLGGQNVLFYLSIALVVLAWIFLYRSKMGLRLRMVGENPEAASAVGLNVKAYKYFGVLMSGALAGLGGVYLSLGQMNLFVENMTAGRGYIAVVINAFGRYNPAGSLIGSLLFGFFDALQTIFQSVFPSQLVMMTPYVVTVLIILFGLKGGRSPAGTGKHVEN